MINYDIVDIRLFERVARYGQLKPAADQMCITVPAASLRIKKLEQFFNTRLFERKPRGLVLTDAGRQFLDSAQKMIVLSGDLETKMRTLSLRDKNTIRLYANYSSMVGPLKIHIGEFLKQHDEIKVEFHLRPSNDVIKAVIDADADIGFANVYEAPEGIIATPYSEDYYGLLVENDNAYFDQHKNSISLKELENFPLVALNSELVNQEWFESHARELGLTFNIRARFPNNHCCLPTLRELHAGLIVHRHSSVLQAEGFRFIRLEDSWRHIRNCICMRSNLAIRNKPIEKLYAFLLKKIKEQNNPPSP